MSYLTVQKSALMQGERIVDFDITEALEMPRVFDEKLYRISQDLSR